MAEILSAENKRQLWIPKGFAHGFYVTSELLNFSTSFRNIARWNASNVFDGTIWR